VQEALRKKEKFQREHEEVIWFQHSWIMHTSKQQQTAWLSIEFPVINLFIYENVIFISTDIERHSTRINSAGKIRSVSSLVFIYFGAKNCRRSKLMTQRSRHNGIWMSSWFLKANVSMTQAPTRNKTKHYFYYAFFYNPSVLWLAWEYEAFEFFIIKHNQNPQHKWKFFIIIFTPLIITLRWYLHVRWYVNERQQLQ